MTGILGLDSKKKDGMSEPNKMSGSTVVEDPGIPLVDRRNGKYNKYVQDDSQNGSHADLSALGPPGKFDNISYRLSRRKLLIKRRRICVNIECTLALIGVIVMLVENELIFAHKITKADAVSIFLKSGISVSTLLLLMAVIGYHVIGIQLHMTDNSLEDWRLAVNFPATFLKILFELMICAIHPIPGNITTHVTDPKSEGHDVSIDAILSILMLMRFYLVGKFLVVHSRLLTNTATQSLGALNKVKINTVFIFKALMSTMPGTILIFIMLGILLSSSWAMRTCEIYYHPDPEHSTFFNCMWMIAITFLTVGYGDIYPNSYCGRFVAVSTGLMGVGTTALLVAVLAQKLEQSRAEKYVHNFVYRAQLDKERKHAASDVIKYVIQLWRMKKHSEVSDRKRIRLHGKLLQAISNMREAKNEKSSIGENAIGVIEISKSVNDVYDIVEKMEDTNKELKDQVNNMESKLSDMSTKMDALYTAMMRK
ncbi:small conductance calcium-activated potassium channel protein 2-like isoform X2 [Mytilus edulis]|uniref:small conductance calcium-activated potassium channel protein 2-like isoform X2 n=1 Tax=Mytilus edulis TaxID=6550 RepID=UPI0039F01BE5